MKELLVKTLAEKANISEEAAEPAVDAIIAILKEKLPGPAASALDMAMNPDAGAIAKGLGGLFKKK